MKSLMDIDKIMLTLAKKRPVFTSEADFQLELAWTIRELYPKYSIRMEYPPIFDTSKHIDIVVFTEKNKMIPIELKYKTKGCELESRGERFILKNHLAKDINCYLYLFDIHRIELFKKSYTEQFGEGYTIMVTNDLTYSNPPQKKDCIYKEFSISNNIKKGVHKWSEKASSGTIKGVAQPIKLDSDYPVEWKTYSILESEKAGKFIYLVNKIN